MERPKVIYEDIWSVQNDKGEAAFLYCLCESFQDAHLVGVCKARETA